MRYITIIAPVDAEAIDGTPVVLDLAGTRQITMEHFIHTRLKDAIFGQGADTMLAVVRIVSALRDAVKNKAFFFEVVEEDYALLERATRTPTLEAGPTGQSTRYTPLLAMSVAPFIQAVLNAGTVPPRAAETEADQSSSVESSN